MKILCFLSFLLSYSSVTSLNDHTGKYTYSVNTPNGEISGEINLSKNSSGEYHGTIKAYNMDFEMKEIELKDDQLSFRTEVSGYSSLIKGKFENDAFVGNIYVEGIEIPIKAAKVK